MQVEAAGQQLRLMLLNFLQGRNAEVREKAARACPTLEGHSDADPCAVQAEAAGQELQHKQCRARCRGRATRACPAWEGHSDVTTQQ